MTPLAPIFDNSNPPPTLPVLLLPSQLRPIAFRVFTKKHNLTLKSDALALLAEWIGRKCGLEWKTLADQKLDEIARVWAKREESNPLVSKDKLAYILLESQENVPNPSNHLLVIDAFEQHKYVFNQLSKSFEQPHSPPSILAPAQNKPKFLFERYSVLKQRLLRNDAFQPPPFSPSQSQDYHKITGTKNLLGRPEQPFMLFGLLAVAPEGHLCLEDADGSVSGGGWFVPGCFVLVDGIYATDGKFRVLTLGHPPLERRNVSTEVYGHIDFLGTHWEPHKQLFPRSTKIVFASDVKLDDTLVFLLCFELTETMNALNVLLNHYSADPPMAFVLCGNFTSSLFHTNGFSAEYKDCWNAFAALIDTHPRLAKKSKWIFVPGPNDPWASSLYLPRKGIPRVFINRVKRVCTDCIFTSNPCRISYLGQEVVVFRDDLLARLRRNSIVFKTERDENTSDINTARNLVRTVLEQGHLSPFHINIRPVLWDFDHPLRLFPLPTALVLADADCPPFETTCGGCHTINPSSLSFGSNKAGWVEYCLESIKGQRVEKDKV